MLDHIFFPALTFWLFPFVSTIITFLIFAFIFPNPNPETLGTIINFMGIVGLIVLVFLQIAFDFFVFAVPFNLDNILIGIDASIGRFFVGFILYGIASYLFLLIGKIFPSLQINQIGCVSSYVVINLPVILMICIGLSSKNLTIGAFYVQEFSSSLVNSHLRFTLLWSSALVQTTPVFA